MSSFRRVSNVCSCDPVPTGDGGWVTRWMERMNKVEGKLERRAMKRLPPTPSTLPWVFGSRIKFLVVPPFEPASLSTADESFSHYATRVRVPILKPINKKMEWEKMHIYTIFHLRPTVEHEDLSTAMFRYLVSLCVPPVTVLTLP